MSGSGAEERLGSQRTLNDSVVINNRKLGRRPRSEVLTAGSGAWLSRAQEEGSVQPEVCSRKCAASRGQAGLKSHHLGLEIDFREFSI